MDIRNYIDGEEQAIWSIFYNTIHQVNCRDYTERQINAWAPADYDPVMFAEKIAAIQPYVAVLEGTLVGYADIQDDGYIDHFFCHHEYQGRGVGRALFEKLMAVAQSNPIDFLSANVSITAKPFFEAMGFSVEKEQLVEVRGEKLLNYKMVRVL